MLKRCLYCSVVYGTILVGMWDSIGMQQSDISVGINSKRLFSVLAVGFEDKIQYSNNQGEGFKELLRLVLDSWKSFNSTQQVSVELKSSTSDVNSELLFLDILGRIFLNGTPDVSDANLRAVLSIARNGLETAKKGFILACNVDSFDKLKNWSDDSIIECFRCRILNTECGFDFYRPIALDFSRRLAASDDWRGLFNSVHGNMSYLLKSNDGNRDIEYACSAIQDVCGAYDTFVQQTEKYKTDENFKNNIILFTKLAARLFEHFRKVELSKKFDTLCSYFSADGLHYAGKDGVKEIFEQAYTELEGRNRDIEEGDD